MYHISSMSQLQRLYPHWLSIHYLLFRFSDHWRVFFLMSLMPTEHLLHYLILLNRNNLNIIFFQLMHQLGPVALLWKPSLVFPFNHVTARWHPSSLDLFSTPTNEDYRPQSGVSGLQISLLDQLLYENIAVGSFLWGIGDPLPCVNCR